MSGAVFFGLKSCDTCRNARRWLDAEGIDYRYRDVREDGLDGALLRRWFERADWTELLNKRSTTWRQLADADKADLDASGARKLLLEHPTLLKRPVLEQPGGDLLIGFSAARYEETLRR